jgi:hypothetical protein
MNKRDSPWHVPFQKKDIERTSIVTGFGDKRGEPVNVIAFANGFVLIPVVFPKWKPVLGVASI